MILTPNGYSGKRTITNILCCSIVWLDGLRGTSLKHLAGMKHSININSYLFQSIPSIVGPFYHCLLPAQSQLLYPILGSFIKASALWQSLSSQNEAGTAVSRDPTRVHRAVVQDIGVIDEGREALHIFGRCGSPISLELGHSHPCFRIVWLQLRISPDVQGRGERKLHHSDEFPNSLSIPIHPSRVFASEFQGKESCTHKVFRIKK